MAQVKVYGRRSVWQGRTAEVSDAIHRIVVDAWALPAEKRFHRFLLLADDELVAPGRGPAYLVVEVVAFAGRSEHAVRRLVHGLARELPAALGVDEQDVEAVVLEVPATHWAIRGRAGDELALDYRVDV